MDECASNLSFMVDRKRSVTNSARIAHDVSRKASSVLTKP